MYSCKIFMCTLCEKVFYGIPENVCAYTDLPSWQTMRALFTLRSAAISKVYTDIFLAFGISLYTLANIL